MKRSLISSGLFMILAALLAGRTYGQASAREPAQTGKPMAAAPAAPAEQVTLEPIGQIGGAAHAVAVQGHYAYVGMGPTLLVLDVSDPANVERVGQSGVLPSIVQEVYVAGHYVHVAAGPAGLRVIDVHYLNNPREVGFLDAVGVAVDLRVYGDYAYIADRGQEPPESYRAWSDGRLRVIDVSNPASPRQVGAYEADGEIRSVHVCGNLAYVIENTGNYPDFVWLRAIDVSDPANPYEVGSYSITEPWMGAHATSLFVSGDTAYVAFDAILGICASKTLLLIDVSNPASPRYLGHYEGGCGPAPSVYVSGDYAYLVGTNEWRYPYHPFGVGVMDVIDASDPTEPQLAESYRMAGDAQDVYVSDNAAYVLHATVPQYTGTTLRMLDVSDPPSPGELGAYDMPGYVDVLHVSGRTAYTARAFRDEWDPPDMLGLHFWSIDVNNPASPRQVAHYWTRACNSDTVRDIYAAGNYAYVLTEWLLCVVDVSDPTNPIAVGQIDNWAASSLHVVDGYAYATGWADAAGEWTQGLLVIDVHDPTSPHVVGQSHALERAADVYVSDHYAYVAAPIWDSDTRTYVGGRLWVVDVSDPTSPSTVGSWTTEGENSAVAMHVAGHYAYVLYGGYLWVIDVSDPTSLTQVGSCAVPGEAGDVYVSDNIAYVLAGDALRAIDVTNPAHPVEVAFYAVAGDANKVYVSDDLAYIAAGAGGLIVLRVKALPGIFSAYHAVSPPTLDGDLTEWASIPSIEVSPQTASTVIGTIDNEADASVRCRSQWDEDTLYFGCAVYDDVLIADSGSDIWKDDTVELAFDGKHDGQSFCPSWPTFCSDDHKYEIRVDGRVTDYGDPPGPGVEAAVAQRADRYSIEVAISRADLDAGSFFPDKVLGFNLGLCDDDDGGDQDGQLVWTGEYTYDHAEGYGDLILKPKHATPTRTHTPTPRPTNTPTPTRAPTPCVRFLPLVSKHEPLPTATPTSTATPTRTLTSTPTRPPSPTSTPTRTPTHTPSTGFSIERVSVASDGTQGNDWSSWGSVSDDGRVIAFSSGADNLVPGDTNGATDAFIHDRQTGWTTRVSVASSGQEANDYVEWASISASGRFVVFDSPASNLVPNDTNGRADIFVHDRETGQTSRVSVAYDGTEANGASALYSHPGISADGRFVAFHSSADNLVRGDTNRRMDVFIRDRLMEQTVRVSVASNGMEANDMSFESVISADGRFVVFRSFADNLVHGDTNREPDIFVRDLHTGQISLANVSSDGTQANRGTLYDSFTISSEGRFVAFTSEARNLVAGDTNWERDVFVHDRETGVTERVSVASDGTQANGQSVTVGISADGRYVAFGSMADNLVAGDTNGCSDAFVHDRQTGRTYRISLAPDGTQGNDRSYARSISGNGRLIVFDSAADNLVPDDTNLANDVFVSEWR